MNTQTLLSRRRFLAGSAAVSAGTILAACGGGQATTATAQPTVPPATAAPTPSPTAVPTVAPTATSAPATVTAAPATALPTATTALTATPRPGLTATAQAVAALPAPKLVLTIGGDGPARFSSPNACVVDAQGTIYVGEYSATRNTIKKFAPDGTLLAQWSDRGDGDGQSNGITSLAVDRQGNLYVADFFNTRVQVFDPDGKLLGKIPTDPSIGPVSVAVDERDNVIVAQHRRHAHYLQKFDPAGNLLLAWAEGGTGGGQISDVNGASAMTLDTSGNVLVSDPDNYRLVVFGGDGTFLKNIGTRGTDDDQFRDGPGPLAVDRHGNIFARDRGGLVQFDPDGHYIGRWNRARGTGTPFAIGHAMAFDPAGYLYLINGLNNRLEKYRLD